MGFAYSSVVLMLKSEYLSTTIEYLPYDIEFLVCTPETETGRGSGRVPGAGSIFGWSERGRGEKLGEIAGQGGAGK